MASIVSQSFHRRQEHCVHISHLVSADSISSELNGRTVIGRSHGELSRALWSDLWQRAQFRLNVVRWDGMKWVIWTVLFLSRFVCPVITWWFGPFVFDLASCDTAHRGGWRRGRAYKGVIDVWTAFYETTQTRSSAEQRDCATIQIKIRKKSHLKRLAIEKWPSRTKYHVPTRAETKLQLDKPLPVSRLFGGSKEQALGNRTRSVRSRSKVDGGCPEIFKIPL